MASHTKITKAVRNRKVVSHKLRRGRRVKSLVSQRLTILRALEVAVSQTK